MKDIEYVDIISTVEEKLEFNTDDFAFFKLFDVYSDYTLNNGKMTRSYNAKGVFFALKESSNDKNKWKICGRSCGDCMTYPFEFIRAMHNICGIGLKYKTGDYIYISVPYIELSTKRPYNILQRSGTYTNGELVVEIRSTESSLSVFDDKHSGCLSDELSMEDYYADMENDVYELRIPTNESEREFLKKRILSEINSDDYKSGLIKDFEDLTQEEQTIENSKSHDYLNWSIPFEDLGLPRDSEEYALYVYRRSVELGSETTSSYDFGDFPPSQKEQMTVKAFYSGKITKEEAEKELDKIPSWE